MNNSVGGNHQVLSAIVGISLKKYVLLKKSVVTKITFCGYFLAFETFHPGNPDLTSGLTKQAVVAGHERLRLTKTVTTEIMPPSLLIRKARTHQRQRKLILLFLQKSLILCFVVF